MEGLIGGVAAVRLSIQMICKENISDLRKVQRGEQNQIRFKDERNYMKYEKICPPIELLGSPSDIMVRGIRFKCIGGLVGFCQGYDEEPWDVCYNYVTIDEWNKIVNVINSKINNV